ncbi:hypothetical protein AVEN_127525-1 [Araneus ventricosus]|uniref:Uncharacterized protein n=1 Tax=Araneus ventricosus TaxID=182803 RepID=A0A4Y2MJS8_ARAVE|nr:hypothetical protein AVEN_127525-1 [Araneus ventricosus]
MDPTSKEIAPSTTKFAKSEGDNTANYTGFTEKPLQLKKSTEEDELATTAWNNEVRTPHPAKREAPGVVPRPTLFKHPPCPIANEGQVEFQSNSSQPPTRVDPFISNSIEAALLQMTSMISNLSQIMTYFMNLMMAMLSTWSVLCGVKASTLTFLSFW